MEQRYQFFPGEPTLDGLQPKQFCLASLDRLENIEHSCALNLRLVRVSIGYSSECSDLVITRSKDSEASRRSKYPDPVCEPIMFVRQLYRL